MESTGSRIAPELASALARAQGEFSTIRKDQRADVQTKSGANYAYTYADLAAVLEAVRPALSKNELALTQLPAVRSSENGSFVAVETILPHSSGHSMETLLEVPLADASPQGIGSALTYVRRYSVLSILGVAAADDDDDGKAAQPADRGRKRKPAASKSSGLSENQIKLLWAKAGAKAREFVEEGDTEAEKQLREEIVRAAIGPLNIESTRELKSQQLDGVLETIEAYSVHATGGAEP
mgnify:CR=1 FL=1